MKKALSLILAVILCLGLCACGSVEYLCDMCGNPAERYSDDSYLCKTCKENVSNVLDEALKD